MTGFKDIVDHEIEERRRTKVYAALLAVVIALTIVSIITAYV